VDTDDTPRAIPVTFSAPARDPRSAPDRLPQPLGPTAGSRRSTRTPWIDIHETADGLVLEADIPGASEQTLTIHLEHNVLSLQAGIEPAAPLNARLIQQEYPVADYERSFILSDDVDRSRISAELRNGVLRIWLPRAERTLTRRIQVRGD
jgi:HSP20 family molecular chaperone IbpA